MTLSIGEMHCERCSAEGSPRELWVARVHLSEGPEGLRFAYGTTLEAAEQKLQRLLDEGAPCAPAGHRDVSLRPGRELECPDCHGRGRIATYEKLTILICAKGIAALFARQPRTSVIGLSCRGMKA